MEQNFNDFRVFMDQKSVGPENRFCVCCMTGGHTYNKTRQPTKCIQDAPLLSQRNVIGRRCNYSVSFLGLSELKFPLNISLTVPSHCIAWDSKTATFTCVPLDLVCFLSSFCHVF